jgi:hypothetical protein
MFSFDGGIFGAVFFTVMLVGIIAILAKMPSMGLIKKLPSLNIRSYKGPSLGKTPVLVLGGIAILLGIGYLLTQKVRVPAGMNTQRTVSAVETENLASVNCPEPRIFPMKPGVATEWEVFPVKDCYLNFDDKPGNKLQFRSNDGNIIDYDSAMDGTTVTYTDWRFVGGSKGLSQKVCFQKKQDSEFSC